MTYDRFDCYAIHCALHRELRVAKQSGKSWVRLIDVEHVYQQITTGQVASRIFGGFLVCYVVASPWFNPGVLSVEELLVLRLHPTLPGAFRDVVSGLQGVARAAGAVTVTVGTALTKDDRRLARVYERFGFKTEAHSLVLEVVDGQSHQEHHEHGR